MSLRQTVHRPRSTRTDAPPALSPALTTHAILRARDANPRLLAAARELSEFDSGELERRVRGQR